jgi:hypothetical protein
MLSEQLSVLGFEAVRDGRLAWEPVVDISMRQSIHLSVICYIILATATQPATQLLVGR